MNKMTEARSAEPPLIERRLSPGRRLRKAIRYAAASLGYHSKPSFIIIGAQKAGTTGLFAMLSKHRQLKHPQEKELHFFDGTKIPYGDFNTYHSYFPLPFSLRGGKVTYEATPSYLYWPECARRIHDYAPTMKLIAILREPVSRAYSAWNMYRTFAKSDNPYYRSLHDPRPFEVAIEEELEQIASGEPGGVKGYLARGFYAEQLQRYFDLFPREQLLVLNYAELRDEPAACLASVCSFIGIDPSIDLPVRHANKSIYRDPISQETEERLKPVFKPRNEELYDLLGEDFGW